MLFDMTYCQECLDGFSDSKFDYRFDTPICLGCGEKLMPYYEDEDQITKENN
jgi:hypothetical protein